LKQVALVVVFAVVTFFTSLQLLQFAVRVPTPSILLHKETAFLAFLFPHVMLALFVAVVIGVPFGYLAKDRVTLPSFLAVLPTPVLFGLFSTWPANMWVPIVGYVVLVLLFCGSAYVTHRLTTRSRGTRQKAARPSA